MDEYGQVLERARAEFRAPELPLESVLRRRDRMRSRQRVAAGGVGVVVAIVAIWVGTDLFRSDELPFPTGAHHHNGEIAVRATIGGGRDAIVQIDPTTGDERSLPIAGGTLSGWPYGPRTDLAWSPDGMVLAYVLDSVRLLDIASRESWDVVPCGEEAPGCSLAWTPDGSRIAVAHGNAIELVDAHGSITASLTPFGSRSTVESPTWSPDSERIAFVAHVEGEEHADGLYVIDRSGSGLQLIVEQPPGNPLGVQMPAWSPDGSKIAYLSWEPSSNADGLLSVVTIDPDGSNPTEMLRAGSCFCLGFTPGLAWSPDGAQMALVIPGRGEQPFGLYVMDADGTGLRLIREGAWARPVWRPVP